MPASDPIWDFVSETLTTRLVPGPYTVDTSPTGVFGLNGDTWYIDGTHGNDSNAGTSEAQAFGTIRKGVDTAGAGDKIHVTEGTYRFAKDGTPTQNVAFYDRSGTPDHWILLAACPGHHPKLEFSYYDCISIQGSSYIIVSRFTIQGPANARLARPPISWATRDQPDRSIWALSSGSDPAEIVALGT